MPGAFIEFRGVRKTYDGRTEAVAGLDCRIERGEFLTFLGPSGSGKTTALMMLAGFEQPTGGEVLLNGQSLARVPPHRRNMGVVFQNYALFPHLTVAGNLSFPLTVRSVPADKVRERVQQVLALVRLEGYEQRRPTELSGGQQQRVALARALVFGPDLILMDEPLGALDKQLREQLQIEIKQIQRHLGVTVVYVTHDQSEALAMSDRIALFQSGAMRQLASPRDLYERPASAFVAEFVGQNNRLDGVLQETTAGRCSVRLGDGELLQALNADAAVPGEKVSAWVRPEHIDLQIGPAPADDGQAVKNSLRGQIGELVYHGDHVRAHVALTDGAQIITRCSRAAGKRLRPGAAVTLRFRREDCRVFAQQPEAGA